MISDSKLDEVPDNEEPAEVDDPPLVCNHTSKQCKLTMVCRVYVGGELRPSHNESKCFICMLWVSNVWKRD